MISFLRHLGCEVCKRDDFVVNGLFYFELVQTFEYRGNIFSCGGSSYWLLPEKESCAVTGVAIFVFAVSLGKVSYTSLIQNVQEKYR